jgi:tetratricopeptide (TPR) repeat protein
MDCCCRVTAFALIAACQLLAAPIQSPSGPLQSEAKLTGHYAKDKKAFFPKGRDPKQQAWLIAGLDEGAMQKPAKAPTGASPEQVLAVEYDAISSLALSFGTGHDSLGILLGKLGLWTEAAIALRQAVVAKPGHAGTWGNLAVALHAVGRYPDSLEASAKAVAVDPDFLANHPAQKKIIQASQAGLPVEP